MWNLCLPGLPFNSENTKDPKVISYLFISYHCVRIDNPCSCSRWADRLTSWAQRSHALPQSGLRLATCKQSVRNSKVNTKYYDESCTQFQYSNCLCASQLCSCTLEFPCKVQKEYSRILKGRVFQSARRFGTFWRTSDSGVYGMLPVVACSDYVDVMKIMVRSEGMPSALAVVDSSTESNLLCGSWNLCNSWPDFLYFFVLIFTWFPFPCATDLLDMRSCLFFPLARC